MQVRQQRDIWWIQGSTKTKLQLNNYWIFQIVSKPILTQRSIQMLAVQYKWQNFVWILTLFVFFKECFFQYKFEIHQNILFFSLVERPLSVHPPLSIPCLIGPQGSTHSLGIFHQSHLFSPAIAFSIFISIFHFQFSIARVKSLTRDLPSVA